MTAATKPKTSPKLKPPRYVKGAAKRWWLSMIEAFDFGDDPAGQRLLTEAAVQLARCEEAREQISKDGLCVTDRFGKVREHPAAVTERAASNLFRLFVRELGLQAGADSEATHLNRIGGRYK